MKIQVSHELEQRSSFEAGIELTLKGTPEMALAVIARVAQEFRPQGKRLTFEHDPQCSTATFIEGTIWLESSIPFPTAKKGYFPIAVIELYSLPDNKALLRIPPRRYWGISGELSIIDPEHFSLAKLVKLLCNEFVSLEFINFEKILPLLQEL